MKSLTTMYLMLLGIALGIETAAGAFVAPVIFFPQQFLGEGVLSHFQSGILMTQVFFKTNLTIGFIALYSLIYEVQTMMMRKNHDSLSLVLSLLGAVATGLFLFYYTPFIVHAQQLGAEQTITEAFASMHKQSEIDMKLLMGFQFLLFLRRGWLLQK